MEAMLRHERIALQFSGGKDSIACLLLMERYLDRVTVYHLDPGESYPELMPTIEWAKRTAPRFKMVASSRPYGTIPSDVVPTSSTSFGIIAGSEIGPVLIDRFTCCAHTIMMPLHRAMKDDGVTLVIRGQKASDRYKAPFGSGSVDDGIEYLFPLETWSDREVLAFVREHKGPLPSFYDELPSGPDCMTCSAWWDERRLSYLKRHHPGEHSIVRSRLEFIRDRIGRHTASLDAELRGE
jgi:phosphoadenosine phosphosulfate reductase